MTPQKQMSLRSCHNKQESAQSRLVLEEEEEVVVVVLVAGGGGCAAPKSEGQDLSAMWRPRPAYLDPDAHAGRGLGREPPIFRKSAGRGGLAWST